MPVKKSVRLVDETMAVCANLSPSGETNWSGSLNNLAEQYNLLIADNTPDLTEDEWNAFYCTYNGYMPHPSAKEEAKVLSWHISEGYQYDEQVRQFLGDEAQAIELIERVKSWSISQRLAVIYKAKMFWSKGKIGTEFSE
jgi:urocanate hydratase